MAGTLLHITLARELLGGDLLEPRIRNLCNAHLDSYLLGTVLVDLPYFEDILRTGIRTLCKKPIQYNSLGTGMHETEPRTLCTTLLSMAHDEWSLALAMGMVHHYFVDVSFHSFISEEVHRRRHLPDLQRRTHKWVEDDMDLHCHFDILGHSGIGTRYARDAVQILPSPSWIPFVQDALFQVHQVRPPAALFNRWLRGLRLFGALSSIRRAPWVRTLPDDNPVILETSLRLAATANRDAAGCMHLAADWKDGHITLATFLTGFPDLSLNDGRPVREK